MKERTANRGWGGSWVLLLNGQRVAAANLRRTPGPRTAQKLCGRSTAARVFANRLRHGEGKGSDHIRGSGSRTEEGSGRMPFAPPTSAASNHRREVPVPAA